MHDLGELRQKQSLPLSAKIVMTENRIREWYDAFDGQVYVSFSGGKDSTVLLDIVRRLYPDVPAVFVDTGLEYPEVRAFARSVPNLTVLKPAMNFRTVIQKYGYPVVGKEVASTIHYARAGSEWALLKVQGLHKNGESSHWKETHYSQWAFLVDAPFEIHGYCCNVMKKQPFHKYGKETGRKPIVGTMAEESALRQKGWQVTGCNAFDSDNPRSAPLSFWTNQDVLQYILENHLPIASIYGDVVRGEDGKLDTTNLKRTGCMFCAFGAHREKFPNRFERMKNTHTQIYQYCMKPMEEGGLGMDAVLTYMHIPH